MENLETLVAFGSWLWSLGWRIALGVFVFIVIVGFWVDYRISKRYQEFISDPTDWLVVMSTVRWDSFPALCGLMNAKLQTKAFLYPGEPEDPNEVRWLRVPIASRIRVDLLRLIDAGLVEYRLAWYDQEGNHVAEPEDVFIRDEEGKPFACDREILLMYKSQAEYKRTVNSGPDRKYKEKEKEGQKIEDCLIPV